MATQSIQSVASGFTASSRARRRGRSRLRAASLVVVVLLGLWPVAAWGAARMLIVRRDLPRLMRLLC
jgi:hypothetical protein